MRLSRDTSEGAKWPVGSNTGEGVQISPEHKQVIRVKKLVRLPPPRTLSTWVSFLEAEEPLLKLLHSSKLQHTNSSPISNCRRSKSAIFFRAI